MMKIRPLAAGALLLASGASAQPAAHTPTMDLRCLVATMGLAQRAPDPAARRVGSLASTFYYGRVTARMSDAELAPAIQREAKALEGTNIPALMQACGRFMQERAEAMQALGQRLADPATPKPSDDLPLITL